MNHEYAYIKRLGDLPKKFLRELESFCVNTTALKAKNTRSLAARKSTPPCA